LGFLYAEEYKKFRQVVMVRDGSLIRGSVGLTRWARGRRGVRGGEVGRGGPSCAKASEDREGEVWIFFEMTVDLTMQTETCAG